MGNSVKFLAHYLDSVCKGQSCKTKMSSMCWFRDPISFHLMVPPSFRASESLTSSQWAGTIKDNMRCLYRPDSKGTPIIPTTFHLLLWYCCNKQEEWLGNSLPLEPGKREIGVVCSYFPSTMINTDAERNL